VSHCRTFGFADRCMATGRRRNSVTTQLDCQRVLPTRRLAEMQSPAASVALISSNLLSWWSPPPYFYYRVCVACRCLVTVV